MAPSLPDAPLGGLDSVTIKDLAGSDASGQSIQGQRFFVPSTSSTTSTSSSTTSSTSTTLPTTLLPGRAAIIKPGTLAKFVAKPATGDTFTLPAASAVAMGGSLRIFDTTTGAGDVTYALPVIGWHSLGPAGANGYKFAKLDTGMPEVTRPSKSGWVASTPVSTTATFTPAPRPQRQSSEKG